MVIIMEQSDKGYSSNKWLGISSYIAVVIVGIFLFVYLYHILQQVLNFDPFPQPILTTENRPLYSKYVNKCVGDRFEFGSYPQGPNGEVRPVVWRVLQRDSDSLLIISEKSLDFKPYEETNKIVAWSDCTLRRWLNGEFFYKAFNNQERSLIKMSKLSNNDDSSTKDWVFLLSVDEAGSLFADNNDRIAKYTDYAVKNNPYIGEKYEDLMLKFTHWWLRSHGNFFESGSSWMVDSDGKIDEFPIHSNTYIRPALRLVLF